MSFKSLQLAISVLEDLLNYELNREMFARGKFKESYEQTRSSLQSICLIPG